MSFKKGISGNLQGRPKGSLNKTTNDTREVFQNILDSNIHQLKEDLMSLEPRYRVKFLLDIAGFCLPKLSAMDLQARVDNMSEEPHIHVWRIEESGEKKLLSGSK